MINLLPDDIKKEIKAARMNIVLLQYNFYILIAVFIMLGLCLVFYLFLNSNLSSAQSTSEENKSALASLQAVRTSAEDYKKDLTLAKTILDNSISFTEVIFAITKIVPDGVVLDNVDLSLDDFGKPILFAAHAEDYDKATMLKDSFEKSNIFDDVFLQNLSVAADDQGDTGDVLYPVSFTVSATLLSKEQIAIERAAGRW
jgi:hypothetical protein